jgi:CheY-like chemotaxis protein
MREKIQNLNCVLLIDDDEATNFYHTVILEEEATDLYIHAVSSAKEGLDFLLSQGEYSELPKPGIIFLDLNMPGMSGWDFVNKYKQLSKEIHEQSVVVLLSTSLNPDDRERAAQIPIVTEFVNKPLTPETFWRVVDEHFS